jgi:hypothetical protein
MTLSEPVHQPTALFNKIKLAATMIESCAASCFTRDSSAGASRLVEPTSIFTRRSN